MLHTPKPYRHRYQLFSNQPCWWMLAGVVDYKLCDRKFDCEHCPFDLSLHGASESRARLTDESLDFNFDESLFYHQAHVWARVEDCGNVRIGLDDFGQKLLGKAYAVSLPKKSCLVEADHYSWSATHKAGETALVVPLNGEIIEVNTKLTQCPSLLNREPFGSGWAFVLKPDDLETGLGNLFYGAHARQWHLEQCETLYARASALSRSQLPDGGRLKKDFLSELSADQVLDLIGSFLSGPREETKSTTDSL
jgi:glycine cleavage system H lipoate-binding protein